MNDDDLVDAFAQLDEASSIPAVDPARTWDALTRANHADGEMAALVDRVARDPAYAAEWRIGVAFAAEAERDASRVEAPPSARARWPWIAAAIAAGLALTWSLSRRAPPDASAPDAVRAAKSAKIEATSPSRARSNEPATLSWTPVARAKQYRVFVSDNQLRPIIDGEATTDERFSLDAAVLTGREGETLLWRVEAEFATEPPVASPTFRVFVSPP